MKTEVGIKPLETDAGYVAATERFVQLQTELLQENKAIEEIESRFSVLGAGGDPDDPITAKARGILAGAEWSSPEVQEASLRRNLNEARTRRAVLHKAIELQRGVIGRLHGSLSKTIAEGAREEHAAIVERIAGNLIALGASLTEERLFRERLNDADVAHSGHLRPMPFPAAGDVRERYSALAQWLVEAVEHGLIPRKMVPTDWLASWTK